MREREDDADELDADAGQRDGGEDDARRCAGDADERDALDAAVDGVDYRLRPHAVLGLRKRDEPREEGAYRGGAHRRHAHEEEGDEADYWYKEIDLFENLALVGKVFLREPPEAVLHRFEADHEEYRRVVEQRWDERRDDYVGEGQAEEGGHEERARAHDRRHYLPAGAGDRFDRAREVRRVAYLLHERDCEGSRAVDVGDRGAGDRAEEAGAHDCNVRGAARRRAGESLRHVHKERACAAFFKEAAEDEERGDERRGDAERHREYAFVGEVYLLHDLVHRERKPLEVAREHLPAVHVGREEEGDERQRYSDDAARPLEQQHEEQDSADELRLRDGVYLYDAHNDVVVVEDDVERRYRRYRAEYPVIYRHAVLRRALVHREEEKGRRKHEAEVDVLLQI